NLLEYALGDDPRAADKAGPTLAVHFDDHRLGITFRCDAALDDIDYTVQASATLAPASWFDIAQSTGGSLTLPLSGLSTVADSGYGPRLVTVTENATLGAGPRRFLRLKITWPSRR